MTAGRDYFTETQYAERVVETTYGDRVSVWNKGKPLNKFGKTSTNVGTSFATVAEFQGSVVDETFVSTNIIDSISSSNSGDTGISIVVEGHTIDASGNLTFVVQTATLDGTDSQTKVALDTPLARATRAYVANSGTFDSPPAALAGTVYIYDDTDGITAGVPATARQRNSLSMRGRRRPKRRQRPSQAEIIGSLTTFGAASVRLAAPPHV